MRQLSKRFSTVLATAVAATVGGLTCNKAMAQYAVTNSFYVSSANPYVAADPYNSTPSTVTYTGISTEYRA